LRKGAGPEGDKNTPHAGKRGGGGRRGGVKKRWSLTVGVSISHVEKGGARTSETKARRAEKGAN